MPGSPRIVTRCARRPLVTRSQTSPSRSSSLLPADERGLVRDAARTRGSARRRATPGRGPACSSRRSARRPRSGWRGACSGTSPRRRARRPGAPRTGGAMRCSPCRPRRWPCVSEEASSSTTASPVFTPTRTWSSASGVSAFSAATATGIWSAARTARSASSPSGDGRAEHRHHRVADELLDRPSEALDLGAHSLVVALEQLADVLGVRDLRVRRVPDQVGEDHRDHLPLALRLDRGAAGAPQDGQNRASSGRADPQDAQTDPRAVPHVPQKLAPSAFAAPQLRQTLTAMRIASAGHRRIDVSAVVGIVRRW